MPTLPARVTAAVPRSTWPVLVELVEVLERELGRAQHRVDQVAAGLGVGQDVAEQLALRDLVAVLVLLQALALGVDDEPARRQAGEALGGGVDEVVGADARSTRRRSARA